MSVLLVLLTCLFVRFNFACCLEDKQQSLATYSREREEVDTGIDITIYES